VSGLFFFPCTGSSPLMCGFSNPSNPPAPDLVYPLFFAMAFLFELFSPFLLPESPFQILTSSLFFLTFNALLVLHKVFLDVFSAPSLPPTPPPPGPLTTRPRVLFLLKNEEAVCLEQRPFLACRAPCHCRVRVPP